MPRLDQRLKLVAKAIRCRVHADIGSDHGHLLKALLTSGRIAKAIAIENKRVPFRNSQSTLGGLPAEVRLADGLAGLQPGEADSLSLCGMGGAAIVRILSVYPERLPRSLVVQPNKRIDLVRRWAWQHGWQLIDEQRTTCRRSFEILQFQPCHDGHDPSYEGMHLQVGFLLGPILVRRREPEFLENLAQQQCYLESLPRRRHEADQRLDAIRAVLAAPI